MIGLQNVPQIKNYVCPQKSENLDDYMWATKACKDITDRPIDEVILQGVALTGNADRFVDRVVVELISSPYEGAHILVRTIVSSNVAQGLVIGAWLAFFTSLFSMSRKSKIPTKEATAKTASLRGSSSSLAQALLINIDPGEFLPPPLSEPLPGPSVPDVLPDIHDTPNPGNESASTLPAKPTGPIEIPEDSKVEISGALRRNLLKIDDILYQVSNGAEASCKLVGPPTKEVLKLSIKVYTSETVWRPEWTQWFVTELEYYQQAFQKKGNSLERAIEYGGRFDYVLREHNISAKDLVRGMTSDEVCVLIAAMTLLALRASVKVSR